MRVYVINKRGEALMPTTPRKTRNLLKEGKAKVIKTTPFTVKLLNSGGESAQRLTVGVKLILINISRNLKNLNIIFLAIRERGWCSICRPVLPYAIRRPTISKKVKLIV